MVRRISPSAPPKKSSRHRRDPSSDGGGAGVHRARANSHADQHLLRLHGSTGAARGETINKMEAPWRKSARDLTDQDYIDLYNYLYPFQGDPLLWVHLNTDYPYNLQGILFPKTDRSRGLGKRRNQAVLQPGVRQRFDQGSGAALSAAPPRGDRFTGYPPECESECPTDRSSRAIHRQLRCQKSCGSTAFPQEGRPQGLRRGLGLSGSVREDRRDGRRQICRPGG